MTETTREILLAELRRAERELTYSQDELRRASDKVSGLVLQVHNDTFKLMNLRNDLLEIENAERAGAKI